MQSRSSLVYLDSQDPHLSEYIYKVLISLLEKIKIYVIEDYPKYFIKL